MSASRREIWWGQVVVGHADIEYSSRRFEIARNKANCEPFPVLRKTVTCCVPPIGRGHPIKKTRQKIAHHFRDGSFIDLLITAADDSFAPKRPRSSRRAEARALGERPASQQSN